MNKKFVVYEGEFFTIEWYFSARGESAALSYFQALEERQKTRVFRLFQLMADAGKIFNEEKFRSEGDRIFAFKVAPDRFLCFFYDGAKIVVTNAYEKKSEKMPAKEKERALRAKDDYTKRCLMGDYYED